ncbi:MAG: LEA type 2 family protein [Kofleriaceae bacterium]|nr:LEA type 2 family protein [Kofleriaceae bacterium]
MLRVVLALAVGFAVIGCTSTKAPELRVLGVRESFRHESVFVQVTNPAKHPMRLTKLEYTFASQGETISTGEVPLSREVPAGAAVVVEVPLDIDAAAGDVTLSGKLTTELDEIVRTFSVSAQVKPQ